MGIVDDLRANVDTILGIRDDIGAAIKPVYLVTRCWSGTELGDGTKTDSQIQMLPSPRIVALTSNYQIREGGSVHAGDLMLKAISKETYPTQNLIDCSSPIANIEKFYSIGGELHRVIQVIEKHVTWWVQLRKVESS